MKPILCIFSILYCVTACFNSTVDNRKQNDLIVYDFMNYFIQRKETPAFINNYPLLDREISSYNLSVSDSIYFVEKKHIFSSKDWSYISSQEEGLESFKINPSLVKGRLVISSDSLRGYDINRDLSRMLELLHRQYGADGVNSISLPLFSLNGQKVIISINIIERGGELGGVYVFEKNGSGWKLLDQLQIWE